MYVCQADAFEVVWKEISSVENEQQNLKILGNGKLIRSLGRGRCGLFVSPYHKHWPGKSSETNRARVDSLANFKESTKQKHNEIEKKKEIVRYNFTL